MTSSYYLAVDVGTSRTAAATARLAPDGSLLALPFALGRSTDSAPSAVFVANGELLYADAAQRRGISEPERLIREFKRRIGDDVPILAGGERFTAQELYALMVAWVVDCVSEREARLPTAIAVTVPVAWGDYRTELVEAALARHGWGSVTLVTEPEAAARHYESTSPLPAARSLAVYDLGGGTFDAVVVRKDAVGAVELAGPPVGFDDVGGSDFDDAVLRHALASAGVPTETVADERMALAALRRECVAAKESLSFDSETVIPVLVGGNHTAVRLTRDEFEGMIAEHVERTIDGLAAALEYAGADIQDVESILLTGGSSRIPVVAQALSERFDRPIAIDADPKAIIALGAVRVLSDRASAPASSAGEAVRGDFTGDANDALETIPGVGKGRRARRWHLPAFAYLSTGSLVVASCLVVASATALGNPGLAVRADANSLAGALLSGHVWPYASRASEPTAPPTPDAPAQHEDGVDASDGPSAASKPSPRRAGPNAAVTQRTSPPATKAGVAAHPPASSPSGSGPTDTGTGTMGAPDTSRGSAPAGGGPQSTPTQSAPTDPTPSDPPAADPAPSDPPAADPVPNDPSAADPAPEPTSPSEPAPDPAPTTPAE